MQDRFKTRIWDKTEKVMHYNDYVITATGHIAKIQECSNDNSIMYFNQTDLDFEKDKVCMFSTGLKDKNGKLIYEGDVVTYDWLTSISKVWRTNGKHIVVWDDGFTVIGNIAGYDVEQGKTRNVQVIGNIYENAELLEG